MCIRDRFVRIGRLAIMGGCSKAVQDILPFSLADGHPARIYGMNKLGLERAGLSEEARLNIKKALRIILSAKLQLKDALKKIEEELPQTEEVSHILNFIKTADRGIAR